MALLALLRSVRPCADHSTLSSIISANSNFFAKHCFDLGIELKRIEVIPDEEEEIIEAVRRMVSKYDWVVTTGGIGPVSLLSSAPVTDVLVDNPLGLRLLDSR
jgi:molybdopterin biosynthesis enzyme